ncbi:lipopolysaccharide biosynthesis protein [Chitinophaga sp. G-6-1-13]|uniref:Lipopolysaccharide biosynthesis protein n=1 Tax=Chitinophaga fulva TaxID=2728842 RepID=A0A848GBG1_9BACT|nr:lipopolysaccharide biosynthesis protein [Chitinophaga fulva]NML35834.1 lipopolysaccharide biosynthesis protein [Chitinophaga fulva]
MESSKQNAAILKQEEEFTLRDLILKIQVWLKYLVGKWLILIFVGLAGAAAGFFYAFKQKANYVGELTFVLEDSKSGGLGGYANLASQFGIDLGGGASSNFFSGENIMGFLVSRLMIEKTLLHPIKVNGKAISLADFYMDFNEMKKAWGKNPDLAKISFPVTNDRSNFTLLQDSVLNVIYSTIVKKNLKIGKPDKKYSFIAVTCTTPNELFSKEFTTQLVDEATRFYVATKLKRSKTNVDKLQASADSLEILLNKKTYSAAAAQDINMNPARRVATVGSELDLRDKMMLQTIYGEVIKNLEISKMSMEGETPVIQIIDSPILPLKKEKLSKLKAMIVGGFVSTVLMLVLLIVRKMYSDTMKE